jgi:membrane-bound lytic murein transglycosylase B
MIKRLLLVLILPGVLSFAGVDYSRHPRAKAFVATMHKKHRFDTRYVLNLLKQAKHQPKTLARYRGLHKVGMTDFSWHRYKSKILIPESIALGRKFMHKNKKWLRKASRTYGISPAIITAFIRVESKFGLFGSEYNVWDNLVTLAFNPNRKQKFFRGELEKVLILARREHLDPLKLRGSFAGAMGCVQQVPSMYLRHGTDLDGDDRRDPNSMADCIGSIAAFLHRQKWNNRIPTVVRASYPGKRFRALKSGYRTRYPMTTLRAHGIRPRKPFPFKQAYIAKVRDTAYDELYLGTRNYRIITRYNASARYAVTIALYAEAMKR